MISRQLIRRYPLFADLEPEEVELLARSGEQMLANTGDAFFQEGDDLDHFYLVLPEHYPVSMADG